MYKYTGITIGPILKTLEMARKPRELWSASYMFSFLMETLIEEAISDSANIEVLSPAYRDTDKKDTDKRVGLFPDRLFYKHKTGNASDIITKTKKKFNEITGIDTDYFNIWKAELLALNDGDAISRLNSALNILELQNIALSGELEDSIRQLIAKKNNSFLFVRAFGIPAFEIETLGEISSAQLKQKNIDRYKKCREKENEDNDLISLLKPAFKKEFKTPHKYICVVHADGDNVGKIVNTLSSGDEIKRLSSCLLEFGSKACKAIRLFKGLPIYAGGDDLLFIAPVISNNEEVEQTIFDLIEEIDQLFEKSGIKDFKGKNEEGETIEPAMSYGISVTYYKYPLYESLNISRDLLFKIAKNIKRKNAIAWSVQKNSGSIVSGAYSKGDKSLKNAFTDLLNSINPSLNEDLVSAAAHKIKANESLLNLFMDKENSRERLDAFFDVTLEFKSKNSQEQQYLKAVKKLLQVIHSSTNDIETTIRYVYGMLRTAKFIKGMEEDKDE
jgi:CRISPR-associated protein Cmr2